MINDPFSKTELLQALASVNSEVADYFAAIPADKFFLSLAEAWSPAENVVHLIKSVSPVAKALKLPKLFLRGLFGVSKKPSRRFPQIKESYQRVLANGPKPRGRLFQSSMTWELTLHRSNKKFCANGMKSAIVFTSFCKPGLKTTSTNIGCHIRFWAS